MAFLGKENFNEIARNAKLNQIAWVVLLVQRNANIGLIRHFATRNEITLQNTGGHPRERELIQRATNVAAGIAVLQSPDKDLVQRGTGHHAKLPPFGNGVG